jgi:hypothetical protein
MCPGRAASNLQIHGSEKAGRRPAVGYSAQGSEEVSGALPSNFVQRSACSTARRHSPPLGGVRHHERRYRGSTNRRRRLRDTSRATRLARGNRCCRGPAGRSKRCRRVVRAAAGGQAAAAPDRGRRPGDLLVCQGIDPGDRAGRQHHLLAEDPRASLMQNVDRPRQTFSPELRGYSANVRPSPPSPHPPCWPTPSTQRQLRPTQLRSSELCGRLGSATGEVVEHFHRDRPYRRNGRTMAANSVCSSSSPASCH